MSKFLIHERKLLTRDRVELAAMMLLIILNDLFAVLAQWARPMIVAGVNERLISTCNPIMRSC